MKLSKATRQQVKLRMGLSGASGFGKTYSALLLAYGMTNDWNKIAVIDTENNSASLYSDLGDYNVLALSAPFSPERYIEAIKTCESAGMDVIIIDSITHEWEGVGGCLQIVDSLGGRFQDWSKVTPRHQAFINAILQSSCHIITTVRRKQDYDMTKNEKGYVQVQKVGTKEVTRDGFEYELTINFEFLNDKHMVRASKDRTSMFSGKPEFVITSETGRMILDWCNKGVESAKIEVAEQSLDLLDALFEVESANDLIELQNVWNNYASLQSNKEFINAVKAKKGGLK